MSNFRIRTACIAVCALFAAASARAEEDVALRSTQHPEQPAQGNITIESTPPTEPDWSVLNWDASRLAAPPPPSRDWNGSAPPIIQPEWKRNNNGDGSSAVTVKRALPTAIESQVGIDMTLAAPRDDSVHPIDPEKLAPGYTPGESSGAAWANAAVDLPAGWDKAAFNARIDPLHEQRQFGTTLSKSVPLGDWFSFTMQNGYSVTQPQEGPSEVYTAGSNARLNVLATGTAFSVGTTMSTMDDRWLNSLSAEQKLFDGISVTGTVSETTSGEPNRSLTAGFKRSW